MKNSLGKQHKVLNCVVRCKKCKKEYKVEKRESHFTWWEWKLIEK